MKTVFVLICAAVCIGTCLAQNLSEPTITPSPLLSSQTAEITFDVAPPFGSIIVINIYLNEIPVAFVGSFPPIPVSPPIPLPPIPPPPIPPAGVSPPELPPQGIPPPENTTPGLPPPPIPPSGIPPPENVNPGLPPPLIPPAIIPPENINPAIPPPPIPPSGIPLPENINPGLPPPGIPNPELPPPGIPNPGLPPPGIPNPGLPPPGILPPSLPSPLIVNVLPSLKYSGRLNVTTSHALVDHVNGFSFTLQLSNVTADDNNTEILISLLINETIANTSYFLHVTPSCPFPQNGPVQVIANSTVLFTRGTFACSGAGELPFVGDEIANQTICTHAGVWQGLNDSIGCFSAPEGVQLSLTGTSAFLSLECNYAMVPGVPRRTIFYVGGAGYEVDGKIHFLPEPFTPDLFGTSVSCQAISPYTRVFNETGRSESVPFIQFVEPTQSLVRCRWRLGELQECEINFFALPEAEFLGIGKNGTFAINEGNDSLSISGGNHTYLFRRSQVSREDFGEYRLVIRYTQFPGLRYVIVFEIEQELLPNATAGACIWFYGQRGVCEITANASTGTAAMTLLRNGEPRSVEDYITVSDGRISLVVPQVSDSDEGNYSLSLVYPSTDTNTYSFEIFVREYPFNPAAVIGVTLAVLVLILIAFAVLVCSMRRKAAAGNGQVELVTRKKTVSQGTTPKPAANAATAPSSNSLKPPTPAP